MIIAAVRNCLLIHLGSSSLHTSNSQYWSTVIPLNVHYSHGSVNQNRIYIVESPVIKLFTQHVLLKKKNTPLTKLIKKKYIQDPWSHIISILSLVRILIIIFPLFHCCVSLCKKSVCLYIINRKCQGLLKKMWILIAHVKINVWCADGCACS